MEKTYLEKRIHERAEKRADKYFDEISSLFESHDELVRYGLSLKPTDGESPKIFRSRYYDGAGIFDSQENLSEFTNWQDIRKELVKKYEKEETDEILSKLENINYLLGE